MRKAGLPVPDDYIFVGDHAEETGRKAFIYWEALPLKRRPTAIFAISDLEAIGIMNEAQARGYVVGRDISVVGFDNIPMSRYLRPGLTTLHQPIKEVAAATLKILQVILADEEAQIRNVLLKPALIKRKSCGAPHPPD